MRLDIEAVNVKHYNKKPCHDCPFRKDIPKYQTTDDTRRNLEQIYNPFGLPVCHHTATSLGKEGPEHACAGALILVQKTGLKKLWVDRNGPLELELTADIYDDLYEFATTSACPNQSFKARFAAWIECQPEHTRPEWRKKLKEIIERHGLHEALPTRHQRMRHNQELYDIGGSD